MKKSVRNILIMVLVLAVLGGVSAALMLLPKDGGGETSSSSQEPDSSQELVTVTQVDAAKVQSITVQNPESTFTFVPQGSDEYTLQGYEDSVVNNMTAGNSARALLNLVSVRELGARSDLEAFDLAGENAVQVEIRTTDGNSQRLVLGKNAAETSGNYVLSDGQVHICPSIPENLFGNMFRYFNYSLYSIPTNVNEDNPNGYDILYHLKLSGANFPQPVEVVYDTSFMSMYLVRSPILAESGTSALQAIRDALLAPVAAQVVGAKVTPEQLEELGLAQPAAIAEFDLNNVQHTLKVSKAHGGYRNLMLDDRDVVYSISDDQVAPWADVTLMQLRMSYIWLANIMNVEQLSVTQGSDAVTFQVTRTLNEEKSTEDSPTYDLSVRDGAGKAVDYTAYRDFFSDVLSIAVLNVDRPEYSGAPAYKVEYRFFEGDPQTVEFFPVGTDRYAAVLNGSFSGQVRKSETDAAFAKLEAARP